MAALGTFTPGGYRYIRGPFQYSGGVAAEPGFRIVRERFATPVPIDAGFMRIESRLREARRPLSALCACEMRSPRQFSEAGFVDFNRTYVGTLESWGIFRDEENPVARSNVCPEFGAPASPGFHAFCYTVPADEHDCASFVIAGSGEAPEGDGPYRTRIIRLGDTSTAAMREKARYVLGEMERRMGLLGFDWTSATATQVYTVHDIHPLIADEIEARGAARHGLIWHFARPPVEGLDFEMDVRAVAHEWVIESG